MNDPKIWSAVLQSIQADVPGFSVELKADSALMKAIGDVLFFNPSFMTEFITTIGNTSYFPTASDISGAHPEWPVLAHEGVHARDWRRLQWKFNFLYLFPQCLAPLAALAGLAFLSHWFLLALVFLVCLAPLPAPGREWAELRGYLMSGCMDKLKGTDVSAAGYVDWMTDHFTTGQYYWMSWGRARARAKIVALMHQAERLVAGTEVLEPYSKTISLARSVDVTP